jgi:hypothetical protein
MEMLWIDGGVVKMNVHALPVWTHARSAGISAEEELSLKSE